MKAKYHPGLPIRLGQSGGRTPNTPSRRGLFASALAGSLFLSLCVLSPSPANAECSTWDVSGRWSIEGDGFTTNLDLISSKGSVAKFAGGAALFQLNLRGDVEEGRVNGTDFSMRIRWSEGTLIMIYKGMIGSDGRIEGTSYDIKRPGRKQPWYSTRPMKCAGAPADGAFVPIKKLKVRDAPSASETPANPPAPLGASGEPSIRANPASVTGGSTTLTWDGGPEHAYAEVWVGVDGGAPTFVVEQGKGSRRVTAEPGKTYRYILTDSGKELATVTVRGPN